MAYFNNFPQMLYNFPIGGSDKVVVVRDITANVRIIKSVLENITLYDEYDIVDGESPEIVSNKVYETSEYHWVLMIVNQRFDYLADWPMTYDRLVQYCIDKYGDTTSIHHYEDTEFNVVNSDYPSAIPIDNITYEGRINESKRRIKIISKSLIQQITNELKTLMNPNG
jgi:hypothetical protein